MRPPLEQLIETYRNNLYAAAWSICQNAQDAEDAVQETFVQYWMRRKEYESERHVRAWLLRVVINKARNKRKAVFRRSVRPIEEGDAIAAPSEDAAALMDAVLALPEKYRIVIHLFYYEDYPVKDIADILHITPGSVKVRLSRGRAVLRDTLKEAWDDDE